MASKKYKLLFLGIFTLLTLGSFAQQGGTYDIYDSSVISSKSRTQQNEFLNNTYDFPAKPRNQMEIGVSGGAFTVSSDVRAKFPTIGGAIHIRKALGYLFSLRLQYLYGIGKGLNFIPSNNFGHNPAWSRYSAPVRNSNGQLVSSTGASTYDQVFYNYKTKVQDLSLQGIFTLNNIRFHKQKNAFLIYVGAGIGGTIYHTTINALDASGNPYTALFNSISNSPVDQYKNRKDVLDKLKSGMDDTYETEAQTYGGRRPKIGDNTFKPSGTLLGGMAFKLGKRVNLALEDRFTIIKDDLLDGQMWQEHPEGDAVQTSDYDAYNYASIGLNFNIGSKAVEPLYWLNPLDYAYSELNNPRHMKLPKPILDDTDGDGVIDQLDREPNTPAGCPVDTHGVTKDTDGDGVPDCKDKQLITPTECQPVDADGVGKCPDPECCKNRVADSTMGCNLGDLPSLSFKGTSRSLSSDAKAMLATIASKLKSSANCGITVTGYPAASKASQALCNKRVDAIKMYLMETEGISGDRITTNCEVGGGDANTVDIKTTNK
jgi:Outer membrane protein and related peptidoglycan-associated (lipo)proteins